MRGLRWLGAGVRSPEFVLVVLLLLVTLLVAPAIGGAQSGEITDCTRIEDPGVYVLGDNITADQSPCIEIAANDVVIDGQGHHIDGAGNGAIIRDGDLANHTVRDVTIDGASTGIELDFTDGATVENVTITSNSNNAIELHAATDVTLRNVVVQDAGGDVIKADHSSTDVTGTNVTLGDPGTNGTVFDFYGEEFRLAEASDPNPAPDGNVSLDHYFHLDNTNGFVDVEIPYEDAEVQGVDVDTLAVYEDDGGWTKVDTTVDSERQTISATGLSTSYTDYGVFGEEGPYFDVTVDEKNDSIVEGDTVSVTATVNNTGLENGSGSIALTTDGVERANETVSLNVSEETTVDLNWTAGDGDAGVFDAAVESEQDSETWSLRVADPDGPIWETDADWNAGTHDRTVSDGVGDRENDTVRLGYSADDSGLVGYWPFDEDDGSTAADASGTGNDGTYDGNGITRGQPGLLNASRYQFDGTEPVTVSDNDSLSFQNDFTVSFWVRTSTLGSSNDPDNDQTWFVDKAESGTGYEILDNGGYTDDVLFKVHDSSTTQVAIPRDDVNDDEWHHLVGVREGDTIELYLDGESRGNATGSLAANDRDLGIGGETFGEGVVEGDMDEVRFYDRSLSAAEVQALHDTTRNGTHTTGWRPLEEPLDVGGLELNASATVPTGDATVYVQTDTDGDGGVEQTSDPISLSSGTGTYDVGNLSTDADTVRLRTEFETTDLQQTPVVDRAALEETATFQVSDVVQNGSAVAGEALSVNATVENVGDQSGTQNLTLSIDGSGTAADETTVELDSGERETVSLEWQTTSGDAGNHTATVGSDDHDASSTVTVDAPAHFTVTNVDTNTPIVENETLQVDATIENTGDRGAEQAVNLTIQNDSLSEEVNGTTLYLDSGATGNVRLNWSTGPGDAGEYDANVSTANHSDSKPVSVVEEDDFQVTIDEVPAEVEPGEQLWVNATVENLGDQNSSQDINLTVDDASVDGTNLTLNGSDQKPVNLTWTPSHADVGDSEVTVTSQDGSDSRTVTVLEPANFSVSVAEPSSVVEGEPLDVNASVSNVGEMNGTQTLNLSIEGVGEVNVTEVTLDASETKALTLTWANTTGNVGDHDATVASENDSDQVTASVDAPANVTVDVLDDDLEVVAGERLDVTANVTNVGHREATQNLTLSVDGGVASPVDETSIALDGGASETVTLAWQTGTGDVDAYNATFSSEDHSDEANVTVQAPANFTVDDVDFGDTVVEGENRTVTGTVSNVGDVRGTGEVKLSVDGLVEDATDVTLDSGGSESVALTWATEAGDAGNHTATFRADDDSASQSVTVEEPSGGGLPAPGPEPSASFQVAIDGTNSPVDVGEAVAVTTTVSNVGDASGTESVALRRAGETLDARNVTLAVNASETIVLEWTPDAGDVGSNRLVVESGASSAVRYVTVESAPVVDPPPVELTVGETTAPLDAGRPLSVTATVEASEDVETTVELQDFGGARVASEPVDLEAGESTTVTLTWQTAVEDAGSGAVTVASEGASASVNVQLREPAAFTGTIESVTTPVEVDDVLTVQALVQSEASGERTSDVVLEIDGTERDVRTVTLASGDAERVTLEWTPSEPDVGERDLTLRAGADATSQTVTVQRAEAGFFGGYAPEWAGTAVDYAPTQQDTHVGGFLWLTALMGTVGGYLLATRSALDARLLGVTLLVAAVRTSTDVLHATVESLTLEPLLALNASLELTAGLLFLAFAAASAEYDRLLDRRGVALLGTIGVGGAALAASNPAHGLVFSNVSLVEGSFTYVSADHGPLGWVLLTVTLGSLLCSVALLGRSFLAGRDPAWRPVGVLASGLCLATVVVAMSVLQRGPLPQYDYTGAGVAGFLLVATTAVGHGLHRIKRDAQRSLIEDLEDPIVITNDAREVVEYNAAAARLLPTIEVEASFRSLVGYEPEWPAPGETTTNERNLAAILPSRTDGGATDPEFDPDDLPGDDPHSDDDPPGERKPAAVGDGETGATTEEPIAAPAPAVDAEAGSSAGESPEPGDGTADGLVDRPDDATAELPPTDVHYLVQTTSVTVETGDTIGYTVRFTDVSELTQRTEELARKNAQLEQVASTISHDLRNPLTVADGYLEIARETVPEPDRPDSVADEESAEVAASSIGEHLEPIRSSLQRMEAIIEDVLALARSSEPVTVEEDLRFAAVVEDAWRIVDTGRATLFVESDGAIDADPRRLQRILENLFRNAVDHVGEDVAVVVGLSEDGFYVADDGPGIPEGQQDDVFEQGHTSSQDGTGLGLSIVTQLARAHGWTVAVDPAYDGARFVFEGCDVDLEDAGSEP